jgi:hypothetical protein
MNQLGSWDVLVSLSFRCDLIVGLPLKRERRASPPASGQFKPFDLADAMFRAFRGRILERRDDTERF